MMAFMDEDTISAYLATSERERFTENTLVTPEELRAEFEKIRINGYALDRNEHHANVTCISGPVFGPQGKPIASISVSAPLYRFSIEKAASLAPEIIRSCRAVSERLNHEAF